MWRAGTLGRGAPLARRRERPGSRAGSGLRHPRQWPFPASSLRFCSGSSFPAFLVPSPRGCGLSPRDLLWDGKEGLALYVCRQSCGYVCTCVLACSGPEGPARHGVGRLLSGDRQGWQRAGSTARRQASRPASSQGQVFLLPHGQRGLWAQEGPAHVVQPETPQPKQPCPALTRAGETPRPPSPLSSARLHAALARVRASGPPNWCLGLWS